MKDSDRCALESCGVHRNAHHGLDSMPNGHAFVEEEAQTSPVEIPPLAVCKVCRLAFRNHDVASRDHTFEWLMPADVEDDLDARYSPDSPLHHEVCDYRPGVAPDPLHRLYHLRPVEDDLLAKYGTDPRLLVDMLNYQAAKAQVEATWALTVETAAQRTLLRHILTLETLAHVASTDVFEELPIDQREVIERAVLASGAVSLAEVLPNIAQWLHAASGFTVTDNSGATYPPPNGEQSDEPPAFTTDDVARFADVLNGIPTVGEPTPFICPDCQGSGFSDHLDDAPTQMCIACQGSGRVENDL